MRLIAAGKVAPFIIVGVDHPGKDRYRPYFPNNVPSTGLRAAIRAREGRLAGDAYLFFLADELKPMIDRTYRTRSQPRFTAVAGASMGGLISLYALGERPDTFGRAAAVSTHFALMDLARADPMRDRILADWRRWIGDRLGPPRGRRLWMDHGTATLDAGYAPYQRPVDAEFARVGWRVGRDVSSRVYQGAAHEENVWAARMDEIFTWLLLDWK